MGRHSKPESDTTEPEAVENTLSKRFDEIPDGSTFILGRVDTEKYMPEDRSPIFNGSHELYERRGKIAFNTADRKGTALSDNCPVIPVFMGSLWRTEVDPNQ